MYKDLYVTYMKGFDPIDSMMFYEKNVYKQTFASVMGELTNGKQKMLRRSLDIYSFAENVCGTYTEEEECICEVARVALQEKMEKMVTEMSGDGLIHKKFSVTPTAHIIRTNYGKQLSLKVDWHIKLGRLYDVEMFCKNAEYNNLSSKYQITMMEKGNILVQNKNNLIHSLLKSYQNLCLQTKSDKNYIGTISSDKIDRRIKLIDVMYVRGGKSSNGACLPNRVWKGDSAETIDNPYSMEGQAKQLRKACSLNNIKRYSKMNKSEMIKVLMDL
mgnify:CR=1 FL=1